MKKLHRNFFTILIVVGLTMIILMSGISIAQETSGNSLQDRITLPIFGFDPDSFPDITEITDNIGMMPRSEFDNIVDTAAELAIEGGGDPEIVNTVSDAIKETMNERYGEGVPIPRPEQRRLYMAFVVGYQLTCDAPIDWSISLVPPPRTQTVPQGVIKLDFPILIGIDGQGQPSSVSPLTTFHGNTNRIIPLDENGGGGVTEMFNAEDLLPAGVSITDAGVWREWNLGTIMGPYILYGDFETYLNGDCINKGNFIFLSFDLPDLNLACWLPFIGGPDSFVGNPDLCSLPDPDIDIIPVPDPDPECDDPPCVTPDPECDDPPCVTPEPECDDPPCVTPEPKCDDPPCVTPEPECDDPPCVTPEPECDDPSCITPEPCAEPPCDNPVPVITDEPCAEPPCADLVTVEPPETCAEPPCDDSSIIIIEEPEEVDFGDLPDVYDVAGHEIVDNLLLGTMIDAEDNASVTESAEGDDLTGADDEDGVTFRTPVIAGETVLIAFSTTNTTGQAAYIQGFVDLDGDGTFNDVDEAFLTNLYVANGSVNNILAGAFLVPDVPSGTPLYLRFRLSHEPNLGANGGTDSGEVEDYMLIVE